MPAASRATAIAPVCFARKRPKALILRLSWPRTARMAAMLLGVFGLLALVLASTGLYGVVAFTVSRRVREVGIRMSLGADSSSVVKMVLKGFE